jgi:hypothetical protein
MKTARLITLIGSIALFVTGCLHGAGYLSIVERVQKESLGAETAAILKTCWLVYSVELLSLAIIAFVARTKERGGTIVLICGAAVAASGLLMLYFLGPVIGVYLVCADAVPLVIGGYLQARTGPD